MSRIFNPFRLIQNNQIVPTDLHHLLDGGSPFFNIKSTKTEIIINYYFPKFWVIGHRFLPDNKKLKKLWESGETIRSIKISKVGYLSTGGRALLPSFGRFVQIPKEKEFDSIKSVKFLSPYEHPEKLLIISSQEELREKLNSIKEFEFDQQFYDNNRLYPSDQKRIENQGPFEIDGYQALLLHVRPLQYNPAQRQLIGKGIIRVTLGIKNKTNNYYFSEHDSRNDKIAYGNLLLNPSRAVLNKKNEFNGPDLLIIYHPDYIDSANLLADWKRKKGIVTEVKSVKELEKNRHISLKAIRDYIVSLRQPSLENNKTIDSRLRYVLFIGDVSKIPTRQAELNDGLMDKTYFPTDYYYSFHPDPLNGIEKFSLPWLSIGRIPAKEPNDVKNIVEKIIEYEMNPPEDSQFYKRILFSGYFMDTDKERNNPKKDGRACRNYINTLEKLRKASRKVIENTDYVYLKRIYSVEFAAEDVETYLNENKVPKYVKNVMLEIEEQSESGESIDSLVTKELKKGPSIVIHRGHGNWNSWNDPQFCSIQFENNSSEAERSPSIFFNINCSTGKFNMEDDSTCMAEDLLKIPKGPPCIVAASTTTRTWRNDSLAKALFDGLFGSVLPTFRETDPNYKITDSEPIRNGRVGDILNYAKTYLLVDQGGMNEGNKDHFEAFNIFGDPSMEIWRKEPGKLELEYKITGNRANKKLKLTLNPKPDEYYISFWSDSKRLEKFPSSLDDILIEDLLSEMENSTSKNEITICCWASGYRFEEKTIELS